jgi:pheromone a factor receptor
MRNSYIPDYIVQGHRYDIVEDFGCRPAIYTSVESILIIWTLPLIMVTLTFIYAGKPVMSEIP